MNKEIWGFIGLVAMAVGTYLLCLLTMWSGLFALFKDNEFITFAFFFYYLFVMANTMQWIANSRHFYDEERELEALLDSIPILEEMRK